MGNTGLSVSRLCFGTLTVGPLQKNFHPREAAELFCLASELGVNFFDTAELYHTYESLAIALKKRGDIIISSKSYAATYDEMRRSVENARRRLDRDYVDIFSIHEVENAASLKGHRGALEYLCEAKSRGIIKSIGISTHTVAGVRAGATDSNVEVIHPLINKDGIGIRDGSVPEMTAALETAKEFGKGIYAMKVIAGGHLSHKAAEAVCFVNSLKTVDSLAIGIQSAAELNLNILLVSGCEVPCGLTAEVANVKRSLKIADWCQGCGLCIEKCDFKALSIKDGAVRVDPEKCVFCGYCAGVCPEFCIKVI